MKSAIPSTVFNQIVQTNSSPRTIAALLNEAEDTYSGEPLHWNAKRRYPFWKACQMCGKPFPTYTKEQAARNKYCDQECVNKAISEANSGGKPPSERDGMIELTCPICGTIFYRARSHAERNKVNLCSNECRYQWEAEDEERAQMMRDIAHKGRGAWSKESEQALIKRMTGDTNPAWKGGVTYFSKKGNYGKYKIKYVRCPDKFSEMARKDGYVMEHRLIVARHLGRPLRQSEVVHHKDHNPENNDPHNLMLFASNSQHKKYEAQGQPNPLWQL
jgi:hypothetical protein